MPQALLAIFTQIASVIGGGINGALGMMTSLISKGFQATIQFHKEGIAFAREVGLSAREAQAYTQVLTERTEKLALKYGVAADAIEEVQRGIIDATGKQYMLNEAEAERQVQINKLVGAGTANQFTEQMMNHMGAQLSTVQGAVSKAYATAAKSGLNAAKFSKEVAKNLSLANKLSFRDGVNGIIRMTALSEKLGFNLQSVENAANKFMDLDSAIESSAQLQMLGGAAGAYGSNPLTMAYEANYDPEAFTKRMTNILGGYAQFDAKTGMANVNGMNRDFVKNIASAMGISMDEAMSIAKKQAEIKYKEGAYAPELDKLKNQEQRDFILNKSYVDPNTRQLMINDIHGKAHNINENGIDNIIKELQEFDNMSEKDIMQRQAETLTNIQEQIDGIGASFAASIAKSLNQYIPGATTAIKNFAKEVQPSVVEIGRNVGEIVKTALDWLKENKETIKNVAKGVFGVTTWLTKHWPLLIALWAGKKLLGASLPGGTTVGGRLGAKALGGLKNIGQRMYKGSPAHGFLNDYYLRRGVTIQGGPQSWWRASLGAAKTSWKNSSRFAKGTAILGAVGAVSQGVMAQMDYKNNLAAIENGEWDRSKYKTKEEAKIGAENERNSGVGGAIGMGLGTTIGTFFGGPVGGMIAGAIGESIGKFVGGNWNKITSYISKGWDKVTNWFTSINWGKVGETLISVFLPPVGAIIQVVKHWDEISAWFSEKWDGAMSKLSGLWQDIKDGWNSYIAEPFNEYIIKPVKETIKWVDENIWQPIKNFFARVKEGWDKLMGGIQKFIDDPWGTIKQGAKNTYEEAKGWAKDKYNDAKAWAKNLFGFETGGIVGGNSYSGDRILTGLNSGEMVLNKDQQAQLFKFVQNASSILTKIGSSNGVTYYNASNSLNDILSTIFKSNSNIVSAALNANNSIKTIPFGDNSFRKIPKSDYTEYSYNKGGEITVKDINLNVNGTLKLDAGTVTKNLDINQLLNDSSFVSSLKEIIKSSINNDMNGGRFMNDNATLRGSLGTTTYWGR